MRPRNAVRVAHSGQQGRGGVRANTIEAAQLWCGGGGDGVDVAFEPWASASNSRLRAARDLIAMVMASIGVIGVSAREAADRPAKADPSADSDFLDRDRPREHPVCQWPPFPSRGGTIMSSTPSSRRRTTPCFVCIESDGIVGNFSARQQPQNAARTGSAGVVQRLEDDVV